MNNKLYSLESIERVFHNNGSVIYALKDVDLNVDKGETIGILGRSGSGKSTLLHILGALDRPSSGQIFFKGKDLLNLEDNELSTIRNQDIGFVFQFHYLLPEFSALENVFMPCLINGMKKGIAIDKARNILKNVGLENRINHRPGELSGGEQQRVAIARSIVLSPKVILADEPTGNLDLNTGLSIIDLLLELNNKDGITSVVVTHNEEIANRLSRTITLSDGKIVYE